MEKSRVIILTDIGEYVNEPDDAQSLVRLMLYANEIDIEGIIPTASHCAPDISDPGYLNRCVAAVKAYKEAYPNLSQHAEGYPDPDELLKTVKQGTPKVYMNSYDLHLSDEEKRFAQEHPFEAMITQRRPKIISGDYELTVPNVGEGLSNDGSNLIIKALEKEDARPVWFCLWGGAGTLAQALYDIRKKSSYEKVKELSRKIRVYDVDGQDDCGAWICKYFPEVKWIRSDIQFWGMSQALVSSILADTSTRFEIGDLSCVSNDWVAENVQKKGALGAVYPDAKFGVETDTPSLLYTIPNGLNDPEHWEWGGWGGRYTAERSTNPPAVHFHGDYLIEEKPFFAYRDNVDTWKDPGSGKVYCNDPFMPVGRWRGDFQNDMAARMEWSVCDSYKAANHNPVAILNGDTTKNILQLQANAGEIVRLDASESFDPDGDALAYRWYVYMDPGTYRGEIRIEGGDRAVASVHLPADAVNEEIHVILEVTDDHSKYPMKGYRRAIIRTGEGGRANTRPMSVNDADVNPSARAYFEYIGAWAHTLDQFGCNGYDVHESSSTGDMAILHFVGRQIKLFGAALNNCGKAALSIDGGAEEIVDLFSQVSPWKDIYDIHSWPTAGETPLYCSKLLVGGEHTLAIRVLGEKNESSSGCRVIIDKAEIFD